MLLARFAFHTSTYIRYVNRDTVKLLIGRIGSGFQRFNAFEPASNYRKRQYAYATADRT
jgi:hypothetical protein